MYRVGKHCWSAPKCGCQLAQHVWSDLMVDSDYIFYQGRNPYDRIVSLYAGHFVDINGVMWCNRGLPSTAIMTPLRRGKEIANRDPRNLFNFTKESVIDYSFERFVFEVLTRKLTTFGDVHVRHQTFNLRESRFDDIILLEDLPEAYSKPLSQLGLSTNLDYENLKKDEGVVTPNKHITPKGDRLNTLNAGEVTPHEWWDHGTFPSSYSGFYENPDVRARVKELYQEDFDFYQDYGITFDHEIF